jgi:hypothetical protein
MARIFDIIEYPNEMREEIVHRFPDTGAGDFRIGSQVIVLKRRMRFFEMVTRWIPSGPAGIPLRRPISHC